MSITCPVLLLVTATGSGGGHRTAEILSLPGYEISTANAASDALHLVQAGQFDLVLLDIEAAGRSGRAVLAQMRESQAHAVLPVIALVADDNAAAIAEALDMGANDCVCIPRDLAGLPARIALQLRARQEMAALFESNRMLERQLAACTDDLRSKSQLLADHYLTAHLFANNVAHEFRTPLTVIKGFAAILADGLAGELNSAQIGHLRTILNRVDDLGAMIGDMLDISRLDANMLTIRRKACNAADIFNQVRPLLERKALAAGISLKLHAEDNLPEFFCDPDNIVRAIISLASNSCKLAGEGGTVSLSVCRDEDPALIRFAIADSGGGLPAEAVDALNRLFRQAGFDAKVKNKGFGLGMNIAKELVQSNFGTIELHSIPESGSTFAFRLPIFDFTTIIQRYTARTQQLRPEQLHVSLLTVHVDMHTTHGDCDEIELFLGSITRRSDLIYRLPSSRWAICTATKQRQVEETIKDILAARIAALADRSDDALPQLQLRFRGSWLLADEMDDFLAAFRVEWSIAQAELSLTDFETALLNRPGDAADLDEARSG